MEKLEIYRAKNKQFGWRLKGKNGKKIAGGCKTFHNKKDVEKSIKAVRSAFSGAFIIIDLHKNQNINKNAKNES